MTIFRNQRNRLFRINCQTKKKLKNRDFWKNKIACRSSKLSRWSKKWNLWKSCFRTQIRINKISKTRFCSKSLLIRWRLMNRTRMRCLVNRLTCISSRSNAFRRTKPDYMKKSKESANKCRIFRKLWIKRTKVWDLRFKIWNRGWSMLDRLISWRHSKIRT